MIKMKKPPVFMRGLFVITNGYFFKSPFLRHRHQALALLILALAYLQ
jgi:hypothetical protein